MSRDYDYIKDLKNDLDIWKIGFGVLDYWIVTGSNENQWNFANPLIIPSWPFSGLIRLAQRKNFDFGKRK